ncbi:dTMP kinase [Thalassotalea euphylliae]|uniref:dTMP kinase n=1 Tax=Thalassotalea euphylliae TaxID=1655234 RepID=UPI003625F92C
MTRGKFIVIEGMEGAGKSSAIDVIKAVLSEHNISFIQTREPGGTPLAEELRTIVKSAEHDEKVTQETELFLMYASRSQLVNNVIKPALERGDWVIGDRHDLSSRAYQGGGRNIDDSVMNTIADITLKGFKPDITIYMDIEPAIGLARARERGALDRIEQEDMAFFERTHQKYREFASQDDTVVTIDASQTMPKVHEDIRQQLTLFVQGN